MGEGHFKSCRSNNDAIGLAFCTSRFAQLVERTDVEFGGGMLKRVSIGAQVHFLDHL